jgi:hypothetical protein
LFQRTKIRRDVVRSALDGNISPKALVQIRPPHSFGNAYVDNSDGPARDRS